VADVTPLKPKAACWRDLYEPDWRQREAAREVRRSAPVADKAPPALPPVSGVSRDAEHPHALVVYFRREPTDDELRALHELVRANAT
jgi:hypothetical protein